jgi:hypothetical protein
LVALVDWVQEHLWLPEPPERRAVRRRDLIQREMPGVRQGGLAGFQDAHLGSEYGQLILQVLLRLHGEPPIGLPIVRAGLESDLPLLCQCAAKVLASWPEDAVPEDLTVVARVARFLSKPNDGQDPRNVHFWAVFWALEASRKLSKFTCES